MTFLLAPKRELFIALKEIVICPQSVAPEGSEQTKHWGGGGGEAIEKTMAAPPPPPHALFLQSLPAPLSTIHF